MSQQLTCEQCGRQYQPAGVRGTKRLAARRFCGNSCSMKWLRANVVSGKTHGQSRTREYRIWAGIRNRCNNPKQSHYRFYGGRGIKVCPEWDRPDGFAAFIEHIGPMPTPGLTVDRKDNTRGYEPGNVRWATRKEQSRNMRSNRHVTIRGVTRTVAEWIDVRGLKRDAVYSRLKKGWDPARALTEPVRSRVAA